VNEEALAHLGGFAPNKKKIIILTTKFKCHKIYYIDEEKSRE
jgi:hypothetical protein